MKNSIANSRRPRWLAAVLTTALCLAVLLYAFPPSLGRAFTKNGAPHAARPIGGNAGIPGGDPLLW